MSPATQDGPGGGVAGTQRLRSGALPWLRGYSVYVAFVLLIAIDLAVTPGFRNPFVVRNLLFEAAPVILITLGQSLAIGTRGIDLSVGSVMALASAAIGVSIGLGQATSAGVGIVAGLSAGICNGCLIAFLRVDPLISSLALLVAARGLAQALLSGSRLTLPDEGVYGWLGSASLSVLPVVALVAFLAAVLAGWVTRRTTFGRYAIFVGSSRTAAFLAGMPVRTTLALVYAASGLLAGLAGVFASARLGAADPNYIGVSFELDFDRRRGDRRHAALWRTHLDRRRGRRRAAAPGSERELHHERHRRHLRRNPEGRLHRRRALSAAQRRLRRWRRSWRRREAESGGGGSSNWSSPVARWGCWHWR